MAMLSTNNSSKLTAGATNRSQPELSARTAMLRYARYLKAQAPLIPIEPWLLELLDGIVCDIRDGRRLIGCYCLWDDIVLGTVTKTTKEKVPTCGLGLLRFFGFLSDANARLGMRQTPPQIAISLMTLFDKKSLIWRVDLTEGKEYLALTSIGVAELRGLARFEVPLMPVIDDLPNCFDTLLEGLWLP